jgi:hypothetical protein
VAFWSNINTAIYVDLAGLVVMTKKGIRQFFANSQTLLFHAGCYLVQTVLTRVSIGMLSAVANGVADSPKPH